MFWIEYAVMVLFIDTDSCGQFSKFVYILEEADYKVGSRILLG
ncbi:unknown [Prevotella sp. CAG:924]|nr:unknown [Prevotella sp. CAG:924]